MHKKNYLYILFLLLIIFSYTHVKQSESCAEKALDSLTLQEKIGQLFVVATTSDFDRFQKKVSTGIYKNPYKVDPIYIEQLIKEYKIGGLIFLYDNIPEKQIEATNYYQSISKIPLLICQDCEWGLNMRHATALKFPRNLTLGALADKSKIYELAREIGRQCRAIGVHCNFAPVVDCNTNPLNPVIGDRSFGEDHELVSQAGLLMMQGLQDEHVIACAKHFPGHGDTSKDSHIDLPTINKTFEQLTAYELLPFKALIKDGVKAVMSAHLSVPKLDAVKTSSLSYKIVTELLEKELNFNGLKITDGLGMGALLNFSEAGEIELDAFLAGNDILLCPLDVPRAAALIEEAVLSGKVTEADLDRRVLKILQAKEWASCHKFKAINAKEAVDKLNNSQAKQLKADLYQEAVTLVKNNKQLLSSLQDKKYAVIQFGGEKENLLSKELQAYQVNSNDTLENINSYFKNYADKDAVVVSILDMNKFKEKQYGISNTALELLKFLKQLDKPVLLVLFGTPYSLSLVDQYADSIVVAYENDIDAQKAVVNILSGKKSCTGKLPITS